MVSLILTVLFFFFFLSAKARAIAIPVDLDSQVNTLSLKVHSNMVQRAAKDWRSSARTRPRKENLGGPDYKTIIEKLQVFMNLVPKIRNSYQQNGEC